MGGLRLGGRDLHIAAILHRPAQFRQSPRQTRRAQRRGPITQPACEAPVCTGAPIKIVEFEVLAWVIWPPKGELPPQNAASERNYNHKNLHKLTNLLTN